MNAARRAAAAAMNRHDAAGDALHQLAGMVGKRDEGIGGFGHLQALHGTGPDPDMAPPPGRCHWPDGGGPGPPGSRPPPRQNIFPSAVEFPAFGSSLVQASRPTASVRGARERDAP